MTHIVKHVNLSSIAKTSFDNIYRQKCLSFILFPYTDLNLSGISSFGIRAFLSLI